MFNRWECWKIGENVLVRGVFGVEKDVKMLCPSRQDLVGILVEGGSVRRSHWGYVLPLWTIYGFDGVIKSMGVVGVSIKLDLAGFLDPPVISHGSEVSLDFGSDGGESSL